MGLSSVNPNAGTFGDATDTVTATVDDKGRVTAIANTPINYNPITGGEDTDPLNYWYMAEPADVGATTTSAITSVTATTSGTVSAYSDSTGVYTDHQGATSGTPVGWASSAVILDGRNLPKSWFKIKTGTDITSQRIWVGWTDGTSTANVNTDTPGSSQSRSGAAFRYSTVPGSPDTTWKAVTFNGVAETITDTGITVVKDTRYDFAIDFINMFAGTPSILFYINGVLVVTQTLTLPDLAIQMFLLTQMVPQVSVVRHLRIAKWHVVGQSTRTAIGVANGVFLTGNVSNLGISPTSTNIYVDIGMAAAVTATVANAQRRLPISITATQIVFRITASLAAGQSAAIRFNVNGTGDNTIRADFGTPSTPTATLVATSSGNLTNGAYSYKTTFVINGFENAPSPASSPNVTVDGTHKQITVGNITTGPTGTSARKVYRTIAGGATYLLQSTVSDNTTTSITDNTADASLGAALPTVNIAVGSAVGALAMAQDDLICWEAFNFVGATTFNIESVGFGYSSAVADGHIFAKGEWDPVNNINSGTGIWGLGGNATSGLAAAWLLKQTTIGNVTQTANAAPGAAKSFTLQIQKNSDSAVSIGGLISLTGTGTSSNTLNINAQLPVTTTFANADNSFFTKGTSGGPSATSVRDMTSYRVAAPDAGIHWFTTGRNGFNNGGLTGSVYFPFFYGAAVMPSATETTSQMPWPVAGTFKYMGSNINGVTGTVTLRVNAADTAITMATGSAGTDMTHTAHVNVGDMVCIKVTQTSGTSGTTQLNGFVIGFLPD